MQEVPLESHRQKLAWRKSNVLLEALRPQAPALLAAGAFGGIFGRGDFVVVPARYISQ